MTIRAAHLPGVHVIEGHSSADERGHFTRVTALEQIGSLGFRLGEAQLSFALNHEVGTVRGLHYQVPPNQEMKLIWCVSGRVFDVLVDVRPSSPAFGQWMAVDLDAHAPQALLVPPGIAHGYQCLEAQSTLCYLIDAPYEPTSARTLRWDDREVGVHWPLAVSVISDRDREAPSWPPDS